MNRNDDEFDTRLRDTWRVAVASVPPALAWRLRPVARSTPARPAAHGNGRWRLGTALAAAAVIALAVGLRPHGLPSQSTQGPDLAAVATAAVDAPPGDDGTGPLDQNPDFYLWLASSDAEQLAME